MTEIINILFINLIFYNENNKYYKIRFIIYLSLQFEILGSSRNSICEFSSITRILDDNSNNLNFMTYNK